MWKYKTQSLISIIGLAVGFVCFSIAVIWIQHETTFDASHPNADNIHRIIGMNDESADEYDIVTPPFLSGKLHEMFPETEVASTVLLWSRERIQNIESEKCYTVDTGFFDVFSVQFIIGDKKNVFNNQYSIVITENTAIELFGSPAQAMGKILTSKNWDGVDKQEYTISGVIKDFVHSNLRFKALLKFTPDRNDNWSNWSYATFIRTGASIDKPDFYNKLKSVRIKEVEDDHVYFQAVPIVQMQYKYLSSEQIHVLPFVYIVILSGISLLLFVCSLFNYISLFTSRILTRVREMGLRKVVGAEMTHLTFLLMSEFVMGLLFAFLLGIFLIWAFWPSIEHITGISISGKQILDITMIFAVIGVLFSLASVTYPVWRICKVAAKRGLTGKNPVGQQKMQKLLIIIQLIIGIFFLFTTSVMYGQLHFMRSKDLGIDRFHVLRIKPNPDYIKEFTDNIDVIHRQLLENTSILDIQKQGIEFFAVDGVMATTGIDWEGKDKNQRLEIARIETNEHFVDFFRVNLKDGRFFSSNYATDKEKLVVNEKLAEIIGNPVGKAVQFQGRQREIIGVIENIYDRSLKHEIMPTAITLGDRTTFLYIRFVQGKAPEALTHIEMVFQEHGVSTFNYKLMDDIFNDFNQSETIMMSFIGFVTVICFIISVFGIYSLTLYSMERRRREIAIRKVNGAIIENIIQMFLKKYLWLTLIACAIAIPANYFLMDRWLQGYAHRISITWWLIAVIVITVVIIVVITVLQQIIKAANQNPAEVVKSE